MHIAILLSTYNGELFLQEQIRSVLNQTNKNWRLYIRDDGSHDNTVGIIEYYTSKYPNQIIAIDDKAGNLKSARSFMNLLNFVAADYYMFCDQDDVWLPFKIEITIEKIKELEAVHPTKGVLVFTDLSVVGADLKMINKSMWNYNQINPENARDFYRTTCLNSVTGCTVMFNNIIKEHVLPYPNEALMHDWWIALNAVHYGIVDYITKPTVLYRQHNNNVLGAERKEKNHYLKRLIFLVTTIRDNIKVIKMLNALKFKVNYAKFLVNKIKIIVK